MPDSGAEHICKSCGNRFKGIYCNQCGEKILLPSDRSFKTFVSNILIAITFADSKFIQTLGLVLKNPGFVSYEFAEGRRVKYLKPISLFFVLNLIYFLFPVIQLFNATLDTQLGSVYGHWIQETVAHKAVSMGYSLDAFKVVYNTRTTGLAKLMVMVFVVISCLPLNLLYAKRNRFFTDHVGYMVEAACFNLFVNAILLTLIVRIFGLGFYLDETVLTIIFIGTNLYFFLRSGATFYHERSWRLIVKAFVMILFLKITLEIYRLILFVITVWVL
jgi:hypothetical protein